MSRKPKKGYYVKGVFVAEGSERDLELKAELKGTWDQTRTDLKKESDALQDLGEALLGLRPKLLARLQLPEKLLEALAEHKRLTNFEAKRRQMQFIGKLMRKLEESQVEAAKAALEAPCGKLLTFICLPFLFPVVHIVYGTGTLCGLLTGKAESHA